MEYSLPLNQLSQRDKRSLVFQLLYSADAVEYETSIHNIIKGYEHGFNYVIPDNDPIVTLANWIIEERDILDEIYKPLLSNWRFDRISVAAKLILRYGVWESLHTDLDITVVINEAVELAKAYAEKDAYKFINGILDQVAKQLNRISKPAPENG